MMTRTVVLGVVLVCFTPRLLVARDLQATPQTLNTVLGTVVAGDTVTLAAGDYNHFSLNNALGTASQPILITGPASGPPAVIHADPGPCCNTIELRGATYVTLRNLTVDGDNVDGAFGLSASGANVHHITVEHCRFVEHDTSQQNVAISTKTPTSGWVIRNNQIVGAGTGMYLGNSDGTDPFVDGVIEHNVFSDTLGYNVQIKWQQPHGPVPGAVVGPSRTVIRHNVFVKNDRASPDGDRPNLLVGGFPLSGDNSNDTYEIYGNVFVHNPRESLLQASGRVSVHDNLFVDVTGAAIRLQNHDLPLRRAWVYNNTVFSAGTAISISGAPPEGSVVVGNALFANTPWSGSPATTADNVTGTPAQAAAMLVNASTLLGMMDLFPSPGMLGGTALDLTAFSSDVDALLDFNCQPKGARTFRGAYAGDGVNPGWMPVLDNKPACSNTPSDGGPALDAAVVVDAAMPPPDAAVTLDAATAPVDAAVTTMDASSVGSDAATQALDAGAGPTSTSPGCGCSDAPPQRAGMGTLLAGLLAVWCLRQRHLARHKRHGGTSCAQ